jgi:hypothetical protein
MNEGMSKMSSRLSTDETPRMSTSVVIAQSLVRRERAKGLGAEAARLWLARKLGVGEGAVRNLVRGKVKRVDEIIRERLRVLLMREIEAEIQRLEHELEVLKASGVHLASHDICEVETHLEAARAILTGSAR